MAVNRALNGRGKQSEGTHVAKKKKQKVWFFLTGEQEEAIEPLKDMARKANTAGEKGAILLQPYKDGVHGGFLPEKAAQRVNAILRENLKNK